MRLRALANLSCMMLMRFLRNCFRAYMNHMMSKRTSTTATSIMIDSADFVRYMSAFLCSISNEWCRRSVSSVKRSMISYARMLLRLCMSESVCLSSSRNRR